MSIWTDLTGIPFSLSYVDVGGVGTRALIAGSGPDVILLHGTSGHLEAFSRNIRAHAQRGYRCHAIDALGHGYTAKPAFDYEIAHFGNHVLAYMDTQNIADAHFIGQSLGGWIAVWLAVHHPNRVRTLQLLAPGGTTANPEIMKKIKDSTRAAVQADDIGITLKRLQLLMHDQKDANDELVEVRHRIYHAPDFVANIDHLLCLQDMPIRQRNLLRPEDFAKIKAPTLIVWGNNDRLISVSEAAVIQRSIRGSRLELFEACGHWPQHEHADRYNSLSLNFMASNGCS